MDMDDPSEIGHLARVLELLAEADAIVDQRPRGGGIERQPLGPERIARGLVFQAGVEKGQSGKVVAGPQLGVHVGK
jgi:hypothetical protein